MSTHVHARQSWLRPLCRAVAVTLTTGALLLAGGMSPASAAHAPRYVSNTPTLRYGDQARAVAWVQHKLRVRPSSGYFGPRTQAAVKRFQRAHHIPRTGVVGNRTWQALGVRPSSSRASRSERRSPATASSHPTARDKKVLRIAAKQSGKRYRYGGTGPRSFDCSGMVSYVYRHVGVSLPHSSGRMRHQVRRIDRTSVRPGDLVFVQSRGHVYHVAIYAGGNYWYEASNPRRGIGKHKAWSHSVTYGRV
jgi:cell wall-associated NlpC family hydrolase